MKRFFAWVLTFSVCTAVLAGCGDKKNTTSEMAAKENQTTEKEEPLAEIKAVSVDRVWEDAVRIFLSDGQITVDGAPAANDPAAAVYTAKDIVFYEAGKDFTYGEGTEADAHEQAEADGHTVVHITQPGTYVLSGTLSAGQIAVDLGKEADEDPEAVVTLILNGVDITCTVAPGVIFYNVYECGEANEETASGEVDTSAAGANVILPDGSCNIVNGSYVARIYKPGTVELSEDGKAVEDAKKLHKYDAAFYSKMTMNVNGEAEDSGRLYIYAENEGLDSELHLTLNGGCVYIRSGNDGINTNEDYVSVTTVNGGLVDIVVTGETGEGDGIDSNGWLVINGGTVRASACSRSADAGIDSDMGIHINGGTVMAGGNMLDRIEAGSQNYAVFQFAKRQSGGTEYVLRNEAGKDVFSWIPENDFSYLVLSGDVLTAGNYTLWSGETQMAGVAEMGMGGFGGMMPGGGMRPPEGWEDIDLSKLPQIPVDGQRPGRGGQTDAERPEGMKLPEGFVGEEPFGKTGERPGFERNEDGAVTLPDGGRMDPAQMTPPDGEWGDGRFGGMGSGFGGQSTSGELSDIFVITDGGVTFRNVQAKTA